MPLRSVQVNAPIVSSAAQPPRSRHSQISQPLRGTQRLSATPLAGTVVTQRNCSLHVIAPHAVGAGPEPIGSVDKHAAVANVHNQPATSQTTDVCIEPIASAKLPTISSTKRFYRPARTIAVGPADIVYWHRRTPYSLRTSFAICHRGKILH